MSRRPVIGSAVAGCAALMLGACARYSPVPSGPGVPQEPPSTSAPGAPRPGTRTQLVRVADIPVGGGVLVAEHQVVVTQPTAGDVRVLSAVCTHQGCAVDTVSEGRIGCPCHGSAFSLTGEVTSGPAERPLPARKFSVVEGVVILT